tara:strand:- start:5241 stop:6389 length:1149 start_codon:yes stop_codon:yes gene_type:complete
MKTVYLDNAATTRVRQEVISEMITVLGSDFGNPSSTHSFGRKARSHIELARKQIASLIGASPNEIIFTSGGTEADNLIIKSSCESLGVKRIISSEIEHHAVLDTVLKMKSQGVEVSFVRILPDGSIDYEHLETLLEEGSSKKQLVTLMHINNEIGNLLDVQRVGELCDKYQALFHSDTVQSVGHYKWDVSKVKIDFINAAAHKFHGPKGVGFAYMNKSCKLCPQIIGGGQEKGIRAGTEMTHNVVGMAKAFEIANAHLENEKQYVLALKKRFITGLTSKIEGVAFNGLSADTESSTYTLVNCRLPLTESKASMLLFHMDLKGIACSQGSACQSGSQKGSHVLSAVLTTEQKQYPSLRFSFSIFNTEEDIDYAVEVLSEFCNG